MSEALMSPENKDIRFFRKKVLEWFSENERNFPWRETDEPFHVLIAEIMLQQTFADKVVPVYEEFIGRYPNPEKAARGNLKKMEDIIFPLGLIYRARVLRVISGKLVRDFNGEVPMEEAELLSLPGVGQYIASAVRSIAFDKWAPVVDANVARIVTRLFSKRGSSAGGEVRKKEIWALVERLAPSGSTRAYNLGLLDFGALVCRHYNPACNGCVLDKVCRYVAVTGS